jgi:hypothetical protein
MVSLTDGLLDTGVDLVLDVAVGVLVPVGGRGFAGLGLVALRCWRIVDCAHGEAGVGLAGLTELLLGGLTRSAGVERCLGDLGGRLAPELFGEVVLGRGLLAGGLLGVDLEVVGHELPRNTFTPKRGESQRSIAVVLGGLLLFEGEFAVLAELLILLAEGLGEVKQVVREAELPLHH